MNNVQKFSLIIIGIFTVLLNILLVSYPITDNYWLSMVALGLVNLGALITLLAHHIRLKWTFKFETVPGCGIAFIWGDGRIGLMLFLFVVSYGKDKWYDDTNSL